MKIFNLIFFGILLGSLSALGQSDFSRIDKSVMQIPDSLTYDPAKISNYINSNFRRPIDRLRAIYTWIGKTISYDMSRMNSEIYYQNQDEIIADVLKTKKGICTNYAFLFNRLALGTGVESHVIFGRTKQLNRLDEIAHAWCAAKIDSSWFLFDPTWAAGSVAWNKSFEQKFSDEYFMQQPDNFIKQHFPFDPLWQFSSSIISFAEFINQKNQAGRRPFSYRDSLNDYRSSSQGNRLRQAVVRIKGTDEKDELVTEHVRQLQIEIENTVGEDFSKQFNKAVQAYNQSLNQLNRFISYRNKGVKDRDNLQSTINSALISLNNSKKITAVLVGFDEDSTERLHRLSNSVSTLETNIKIQQDYLTKLK